MLSETDFRMLLFRVGKLLSPRDVESLLFLSASQIRDKRAVEECRKTLENPMNFFTIMMERGAYTREDPTLLLCHLENLGNEAAVREVRESFYPQISAVQATTFNASRGLAESSTPCPGMPVQESIPNQPPTAVLETSPPAAALGQCMAVDGCRRTGSMNRPTGHQEPEASIFGDDSSSKYMNNHGVAAAVRVKAPSADWMLPAERQPETLQASSPQAASSSGQVGGSSRRMSPAVGVPDQVEDLELLRLSQHFEACKLYYLGLQLGYTSGRISQIEQENRHHVAKAFFDILLDWKNHQPLQSQIRSSLAGKLFQIGCPQLSHDLLTGKYMCA